MPLKRAGAVLALAALPATAGCGAGSAAAASVPEVLNTTVAFAPRCHLAAYSSNRDGAFRPFLLELAPGREPRAVALRLRADEDYFVRSVSADCATLALVADQGGNGTYHVFLYDLKRARLTRLGDGEMDEGEPEFAPGAPLLALLSGGDLRIYDLRAGRFLETGGAATRFASLAWAPEGGRLFLEDDVGGIWEYSLSARQFRSVWTSGRESASPRMLSSRGDRLYFVSDHESDVSQVYRLDLRTGAAVRLFPSAHDQASPEEREDGTVLYRTNLDGSFVAVAVRGGRSEIVSPPRGVVYGLSLDFGRPLLLWAGNGAPVSLYAYAPGSARAPRPLVPAGRVPAWPEPRVWRSPEGMPHFLYLPRGRPKGWIVWLHGGPNEQVSPRYNPFFDALLSHGYAVAALNYPGSTGIGNRYELRDVPEGARVDRQLQAIVRDLGALRQAQPGFERYAVVGVSYGAELAQLLVRSERKQAWALVDFSGMLDRYAAQRLGKEGELPPALFIHGKNDAAQQTAERQALLRAYRSSARVKTLAVGGEGHFIRRRGSVARIAAAMTGFLDRYADASPQR